MLLIILFLYISIYNKCITMNKINVLHFQGQSFTMYEHLHEKILNEVILTDVPNIDIISCWTDDEKCLLKKQLDKNGIKLINALPVDYDTNQEWYMPNKIAFYIMALEQSTSEICMLLDGYDVLFATFENIIDKFKNCGYKILFNASRNNYPVMDIDYVPNREELPITCYFNAGCCIGYRKDLIEFYKKCYEIIPYIDNPQNSEQMVLRYVFSEYSDKEQNFIGFDAYCSIFHTVGKTVIAQVKENSYILI